MKQNITLRLEKDLIQKAKVLAAQRSVDSQAGSKHLVARDILRSCWHHQGAVISTQVLQEFYVNITRKIPQPLSLPPARRLIEQYR
ncbi:MAG: hypothetical protein U5L00_16380 [Desulfovermiculus sp.]|nr:hypothetical protein [Desulfovermiculus sp.]